MLLANKGIVQQEHLCHLSEVFYFFKLLFKVSLFAFYPHQHLVILLCRILRLKVATVEYFGRAILVANEDMIIVSGVYHQI